MSGIHQHNAPGIAVGTAWLLGGNTLLGISDLGTLSAHPLPFITAGTEKGRITIGGRWGINNTTPLGTMHIIGLGGIPDFATGSFTGVTTYQHVLAAAGTNGFLM